MLYLASCISSYEIFLDLFFWGPYKVLIRIGALVMRSTPFKENPTCASLYANTYSFRYYELTARKKLKPRKIRILLIEDEKIFQIAHTFLLEKIGYEFDIAEDGQQALQMFSRNNYDLVLLDIDLRGTCGTRIGESIRAHKKGKSIPLLALTGFGGLAEEDLKMVFNEVLPKPVEFRMLETILEEKLMDNAKVQCL